MARAVWSGTISFGLVNVPVKAYTAVRDHKVHFHELDAKGGRVRHEKVSAKTGKPVDDLRLGYETSKGHYVRFTPKEIEELRPASTRTIEVTDFVDLAEIDPIFYDRTYWLAPAGDDAKDAYALLRDAMDDAQKVAIGTVVMRRKQYLAAVRPIDGALAMSTMRFADEVVPSSTVDGIPARGGKGRQKERALAGQIIDALASDWDPTQYTDQYKDNVMRVIQGKLKGKDVHLKEEATRRPANVVNLMERLKQSLEQTTRGSKSSKGSRGSKGARGSKRSLSAAAKRAS